MNCAPGGTAQAIQRSRFGSFRRWRHRRSRRRYAWLAYAVEILNWQNNRVLKRLKESGIRLDVLPIEGMGSALAEETALRLALLFRTLAPMRNRDNMRLVAEGIEAMGKEEAGYWLGMSVHRKNPRRVLTALRILLTDPTK